MRKMFLIAVWLLADLQTYLVRNCFGISLPKCETNIIEINMASSDNEITCEGARISERIQWEFTDGGFNGGIIRCEVSGTCDRNSAFSAFRTAASNSSTLTPNLDIRKFRTVYGAMTVTCFTINTQNGLTTDRTSCQLDVVHTSEVTSCSARFNTTPGTSQTVSGSCDVGKAYSMRGRYSCQWKENFSGTSDDIVSTVNMTGSSEEGDVTYRSMTCDFSKPLPRVTGSYNYTVVISPGAVQPDVNFAGSSDISLPTASTSCPADYVTEGNDVDCSCKSINGNPDGSAVWRIQPPSSRLLLRDVRRGSHGNSFVCEVRWGSQVVSSYNFTLQVAYKAEVSEIAINGVINNQTVVNENDTISFKCTARGRPTAHIVLKKNGKVIGQRDLGDVSRDDVAELVHTTQYAQCEDSGLYTCSATNEIGDADQHVVKVFVNCGPRHQEPAPTYPSKLDYKGRPVQLSVDMLAFPLPDTFTYVFHGPGNNVSESVTSGNLDSRCWTTFAAYAVTCNIIVNNITSGDAGFYSVWIGNGVGNVTISFEVKYFETDPQAGESSSGGLSTVAAVGVALALVFVVVGVVVVLMWRRHWVLPCASSSAIRSNNTEHNQAAVSPPVSVEREEQQNARPNEMPGNKQQATNQYDSLQPLDVGVRSDYAELSHCHAGMKSDNGPDNKQQATNQYEILRPLDIGVRSDYAELSHCHAGMKSDDGPGSLQGKTQPSDGRVYQNVAESSLS